jgi:hypothetical protein
LQVQAGGVVVVYSMQAIVSSVRSISLRILSLVTLLIAGGGVLTLVVTVRAAGRVIQPMNLVNPLSIGRVGMNPLIQEWIRGLMRSPAEVMKNRSGTDQS